MVHLDDLNKVWYIADSMHYLVNIPICDNTSYNTALAVARDIEERADSVETAQHITDAFYGEKEAKEAGKVLSRLVPLMNKGAK